MALHVALRHPDRLAGVVALSCYVVGDASLEREASAANRGLPIFQAHGTDDPIVPLPLGVAARDRLSGLGYEVEWHTYDMAHQVVPEEIEAIGGFLRRLLATPGEPPAGPGA